MMEPSKWISPGGKVHWRRLRFWVGTRFEKAADDKHVVVLCGRWSGLNTPAPADAEVTCGVCLKSANTGAHLPRASAENGAPAHEHEWEVEYLPDPMSGGGVVRSGDLFCRCGATREDRPIPPGVQREQS